MVSVRRGVGLFGRMGDKIDDNGSYAPVVISTVALAVLGAWGSPWWIMVIIGVLTVLSLFFSVRDRLKQRTVAEAQADLAESEEASEHYFETILESTRRIARKTLESIKDDSTTRATLYCHDPRRNVFIPVGRVSSNPTIVDGGRAFYPVDQGLIGTCWQKGTASVSDFPTDADEWARASEAQTGLPYDVAIAIQFKARSIAMVRLEKDDKPVGIIAFESTEPRGVTSTLMEKHQEDALLSVLGDIVFLAQDDFAERDPGPR